MIMALSRGGGPASEAKVADIVESCEQRELFVSGVNSPLYGPGIFWVFNAQLCSLFQSRDTFSLIFDKSSSTPKTDKNRVAINLRYFNVITYIANLYFLIFMKKVCL